MVMRVNFGPSAERRHVERESPGILVGNCWNKNGQGLKFTDWLKGIKYTCKDAENLHKPHFPKRGTRFRRRMNVQKYSLRR